MVRGEINKKTAYIQARSSMARALEVNGKECQAEGEAKVDAVAFETGVPFCWRNNKSEGRREVATKLQLHIERDKEFGLFRLETWSCQDRHRFHGRVCATRRCRVCNWYMVFVCFPDWLRPFVPFFFFFFIL